MCHLDFLTDTICALRKFVDSRISKDLMGCDVSRTIRLFDMALERNDKELADCHLSTL